MKNDFKEIYYKHGHLGHDATDLIGFNYNNWTFFVEGFEEGDAPCSDENVQDDLNKTIRMIGQALKKDVAPNPHQVPTLCKKEEAVDAWRGVMAAIKGLEEAEDYAPIATSVREMLDRLNVMSKGFEDFLYKEKEK